MSQIEQQGLSSQTMKDDELAARETIARVRKLPAFQPQTIEGYYLGIGRKMADALVWQLIRTHNSFLVKRGRTKRDGAVQFSSEKGNLLNVNSFKYSGVANSSTIDVSKESNKLTLTVKDGKDTNKPKKSATKTVFKLNPKHSLSVLSNTASSGLRGDLLSAANARYKKLDRALKVSKGLKKAPVVGKSRGSV